MSRPFRPADCIVRGAWGDREPQFDLTTLSKEHAAGVLVQWSMSQDLRAEIVRMGTNTTQFCKTYGLKQAPVAAMLNGHRMTSFETYAAVMFFIKERMPHYTSIEQRLLAAIAAAKKSGGDVMSFSTAASEATGQEPHEVMLPTHPDSALAQGLHIQTILSDARVQAHLDSLRGTVTDPADLTVEFDAFSTEHLGESLVDGFVAERLIGGRLVLSADWRSQVLERCGGVIGGVFVVRPAEYRRDGSIQDFIGARVVLDPEDAAPGEADISIVNSMASVDSDGVVRWRS